MTNEFMKLKSWGVYERCPNCGYKIRSHKCFNCKAEFKNINLREKKRKVLIPKDLKDVTVKEK